MYYIYKGINNMIIFSIFNQKVVIEKDAFCKNKTFQLDENKNASCSITIYKHNYEANYGS